MCRFSPYPCTGSMVWRIFALLTLLSVSLLFSAPVSADYVHLRLDGPDEQGEAFNAFFALSPDGKRIVYVKAIEYKDDGLVVNELLSVPISGGRPVLLAQVTTTCHDSYCLSFQISPDSSRVVYKIREGVNRDGMSQDSLYSVPFSGGMSVRLDEPVSAEKGKDVSWQISPDSRHVVYDEIVEGEAKHEYHRSLYGVVKAITGRPNVSSMSCFESTNSY